MERMDIIIKRSPELDMSHYHQDDSDPAIKINIVYTFFIHIQNLTSIHRSAGSVYKRL